MKSGKRLIISLFHLILLSQAACAIPPLSYLNAYPNSPLEARKNDTNAEKFPAPSEDYFIGLVLSGGGSRAANFSAAVMWELSKLGILQEVQYISSVSGGSLPAAYYVLFKDDNERWSKGNLKQTFSQNFERRAFLYTLNPIRFIKFLGTGYDRTDVISEVFANRLYFDKAERRNKTFGDLPEEPRLIVNATNYVRGGAPFTFTNDDFTNQLRSDLRALSIGRAVAASAAFPGLLRNATFAVFKEETKKVKRYRHLFDGGSSDNLGIESLLNIYDEEVRRLENEGKLAFNKGCLIIMVDSYNPFYEIKEEMRPDTRRFYDFPIDFSTAKNSFSILLQTKRRKTLQRLGFDGAHLEAAVGSREPVGFVSKMKTESVAELPKGTFRERRFVQGRRANCKIWHISVTQFLPIKKIDGYTEQVKERYEPIFAKMMQERGKNYSYGAFVEDVNRIPTRFRIAEDEVENLYTAADILVNERQSKGIICEWIQKITRKQLPACQ